MQYKSKYTGGKGVWLVALLILQLAVLTPEAVRILLPAKNACRADCPMHQKKLRCHTAKSAAKEDHCPHAKGNGGLSFVRGTACSCGSPHHEAVHPRDPSLVPPLGQLVVLLEERKQVFAEAVSPEEVALDPPFRPPQSPSIV